MSGLVLCPMRFHFVTAEEPPTTKRWIRNIRVMVNQRKSPARAASAWMRRWCTDLIGIGRGSDLLV